MELKIPQDKEGRGLGQMLLKGVLHNNKSSLVVDTEYDIIINVKNVLVVPFCMLKFADGCRWSKFLMPANRVSTTWSLSLMSVPRVPIPLEHALTCPFDVQTPKAILCSG